MYNYIKGKFIEADNDYIVVESNGVGFQIYFPMSNIINLPSENEEVKIWTYMAVREDDISLYGFLKKEDRNVFLKLITVNGVGPKAAMNIISHLGFSLLITSVLNNDDATISKVPGIGKKTAAKIILDLSDKIKKMKIENSADVNINIIKEDKYAKIKNDAIDALCALGYQKKTATNLIDKIKIDDNTTIEELIKLALK